MKSRKKNTSAMVKLDVIQCNLSVTRRKISLSLTTNDSIYEHIGHVWVHDGNWTFTHRYVFLALLLAPCLFYLLAKVEADAQIIPEDNLADTTKDIEYFMPYAKSKRIFSFFHCHSAHAARSELYFIHYKCHIFTANIRSQSVKPCHLSKTNAADDKDNVVGCRLSWCETTKLRHKVEGRGLAVWLLLLLYAQCVC